MYFAIFVALFLVAASFGHPLHEKKSSDASVQHRPAAAAVEGRPEPGGMPIYLPQFTGKDGGG
jgi:hypothetical protein